MKEVYDKRMSLTGHLAELRTCLIVSVIAVAISFAISFYFSEELLRFLTRLINEENRPQFIFFTPAEALWTNFKVAMFAGIILAFPVILYEIWRFIYPALHEKERKYALPFLISGVVFFAIGLVFCYAVVLKYALNFLMSYKTADLTPLISIGSYLDFVMKFMLAFGLIFELPLAIIFLTKIGLLTPQFLSKNRKYAILINFVVAAILTPTPDVFNQLLMAVPLIVLYELGILGARIFCRDVKKSEV